MEQGMGVLETVATKTSNDILLLMIIIAVLLLLLSIPLFKLVSKASMERRKQELDREALILDVIRENTNVNAGLKALLEQSNKHCDDCKAEQFRKFDAIIQAQTYQTELLTKIGGKLSA